MSGTILAIDNDATIAGLIAEILQDEGYRVHTASTPTAALALALTIQPNLILCDLHMPSRNGMSLIEELQGCIDVPMVMITADRAAPADLVGYSQCILKPFAVAELIDCVAKYIHGSS